jgi:DNA-binding CsgD family transcriptional regulator
MFDAQFRSEERLLLQASSHARPDKSARYKTGTLAKAPSLRRFPVSAPHTENAKYRSAAAQNPINAGMILENRDLQALLKVQTEKNKELEGILRSMNIAALFVEADLMIRSLTSAAGLMSGIEPSVIGKAFSGTGARLQDHPSIGQMVAATEGKAPCAFETAGRNGTHYLCRVLPVRTSDGGACGMVITWTSSNNCPKLPAPIETSLEHSAAESADTGGMEIPRQSNPHCLTPRQQQIMGLVLDGHPNKNIAVDLCISQRTVENHRAAIMRRTGATSLPALARIAIGASRDADHRLEPRLA